MLVLTGRVPPNGAGGRIDRYTRHEIDAVVPAAGMLCVVSRAQAQDSPENYHLEAAVMFWKPSSPEIVITSGSARHTGRFREPVRD